jgi:hypothetical protein
MAQWHEVEQGETFSSIADHFGFCDYRTVYNHWENAQLHTKRPNPDIIFKGDCIYIPDFEAASFLRATDQTHKFVVSNPNKVLRIRLQDFNGQPFIKTPYELHLGSQVLAGSTDANGILEKLVPVQTRLATLKIESYEWTLNIGDLNPIDNTTDLGISGIQQRLSNLGFDPGPIDGTVGPRTTAAIRGFQKKHPPLPVDGVCNPDTKARLVKEHGS